jgi:hypothetical protein
MSDHLAALEEVAADIRAHCNPSNPESDDEVSASYALAWADRIAAAIALMRGQSGWISVKDATPDEDVPVWCLTKGDGIFIGGYVNIDEGWVWTNTYTSIYHTLKNGEWKWEANDFEYDDEYEVIAWMPLPSPPKPKDTAR